MVPYPSGLLPIPDVVVEQFESMDDGFAVNCHSSALEAHCPGCGSGSSRIHSYRQRTLQDLPGSGYAVKLQLRVGRFRCSNSTYARRTFTERLERLTTAWARCTNRVTLALKNMALALGGEAVKRVTNHLAMATSGDTLIRILRIEVPVVVVSPQLGVDDWAIRRGRSELWHLAGQP